MREKIDRFLFYFVVKSKLRIRNAAMLISILLSLIVAKTYLHDIGDWYLIYIYSPILLGLMSIFSLLIIAAMFGLLAKNNDEKQIVTTIEIWNATREKAKYGAFIGTIVWFIYLFSITWIFTGLLIYFLMRML